MKKLYNYEIVNISEIDKFAVNSYCAIHGTDPSINLGDITKIDVKTLPEISTLVGGSPCVNFSSAGNKNGSKWVCLDCGKTFDPLELDDISIAACPKCNSENLEKTESSLIVYWLNILKATTPNFAIFENVKNLLSKRFESTFKLFVSKIESFGYNCYYQVLNAKDYGIPQNRERVFFLAIRKDVDNGKFKFPEPCGLKFTINDLLEDNEEIYHSKSGIIVDATIAPYVRKNINKELAEIVTSTKNIYRMKCTSGYNDHAIGIKYVPALRASNPSTIAMQSYDTTEGKKHYIKRLTPLEAFRFMGFSDEDYHKAAKVTCKSQLYKQCGNSIVVNVVYEVLKNLFEAMPYLFENIKILDLFAGIGAFEKAFKRVIDEENYAVINSSTLFGESKASLWTERLYHHKEFDKWFLEFRDYCGGVDICEIAEGEAIHWLTEHFPDLPYKELFGITFGIGIETPDGDYDYQPKSQSWSDVLETYYAACSEVYENLTEVEITEEIEWLMNDFQPITRIKTKSGDEYEIYVYTDED